MSQINEYLAQFAGWVWGLPLIVLLFGTHVYLTIRLGFIQRYIPRMIRVSFQKDPDAPGDVSQFGALATALAATIGTGNIFGVAGAVAIGGPGAVLWMWLTGVFGIATKYAESLLAVKYRVKGEDGRMAGGAMYVLEHALGMKWLGVLFAVFTALAAFGIGNMVQANTLTGMLHDKAGLAPWISGLVLAIGTALVVLGGIQWIAHVCVVLVPFMAVFYVVGCLAVLAMRVDVLGDTVLRICSDAFSGSDAVAGGFIGATIRQAVQMGIARGLFSNESGLGSAPIVAAAAQTRNPVRQAMVSATGTFWDTVVVCALTGLVIVSSGEWATIADKKQLTSAAFADAGLLGTVVLTGGLFTFVFSTILGWCYYGERAVNYLAGKAFVTPYRVLWVIAVFVGSVSSTPAVWDFADAMNGLMAVPNLIAMLALTGVVVAETRAHRGEFTGDADDSASQPPTAESDQR
jgi:AGCS family alanine or glycine:cation symporter